MHTQSPPTSRVRFIEHRGARILLIDFSGLQKTEEILREVEVAREVVAGQRPASLRTLTHVKGARYTPPVMEALKQLTVHNKPYVTAAAVVGMEGLHRVLFRAVVLFSRRNIEAFDTMEEARDWLASQP
ncbi:MAG TPA: hypothetical protein VGB92_02890 [Longimicrobium sp.]|jgi:hypothetical protein